MKKYNLIILIFLIAFSCKNPEEKHKELITIENALNYKDNTMVFDDVRFVKFDNNPEALFGSNVKLNIYNGKIYVLDYQTQGSYYQTQGSLLCFDGQGNFINKIGKKGKGPEEYLSLYDFGLKEDTIELLTRNGNKSSIYKYLPNGAFINKLELGQRATDFEFTPEGNYLINTGYSHNDSCRIYILDNKGEVKQSFFKNVNVNISAAKYDEDDVIIDIMDFGNSFFKSKEFLLFCEALNDTIYSFSGNKLLPEFIVDFGSYANSEINKSDMYSSINSGMAVIQKGISTVMKSYGNNEYALINYDFYKQGVASENYLLLYNKKSHNITTLVSGENNSIISKLMGLTEDNEIMFIVYPFGEELKDLKRMFPDVEIPDLGENDNAMLAFCKISKKS